MNSDENAKPKRKLKKWQIVLLVITVLFVIGSLSGGNSTSDNDTTTPTPSNTQNDQPSNSNETISQKNAIKKADSYLSYTSFSRSGLIEQLEFEGFSTSDATYGVDAQNANWDEQAAKKAKSYLSYTSFSRSGLIEQLEFDGFTQKQAEYGVSANGF